MSEDLEIELAGSDPVLEDRARRQLERIVQRWDVAPWLYTHRVVIAAGVVPHSHPVLTWTTRYLHDDVDALGGFLHEQIHWGIHRSGDGWPAADLHLRGRYPDLPEAPPKGCGTQGSNYLHLAVNYLELLGLTDHVGEDVARRTLASRRYYTAIYEIVLTETKALAELFERCGAVLQPAV